MLKDAYDLGATLYFLYEQKSFDYPPMFSCAKDMINEIIKALVAIDDDHRTKVEDLDLTELRKVCDNHLELVKNK